MHESDHRYDTARLINSEIYYLCSPNIMLHNGFMYSLQVEVERLETRALDSTGSVHMLIEVLEASIISNETVIDQNSHLQILSPGFLKTAKSKVKLHNFKC